MRPGKAVCVDPTLASGAKPGSFRVHPPLPEGLQLDEKSGRLEGALQEPIRSVHEVETDVLLPDGSRRALRCCLFILVRPPLKGRRPKSRQERLQEEEAEKPRPVRLPRGGPLEVHGRASKLLLTGQRQPMTPKVQNVLFECVQEGYLDKLSELMNDCNFELCDIDSHSVVDGEGRTLLEAARRAGYADILQFLYRKLLEQEALHVAEENAAAEARSLEGSVASPPVTASTARDAAAAAEGSDDACGGIDGLEYPNFHRCLPTGKPCLYEPKILCEPGWMERYPIHGRLRFSVMPPLPRGLVIEERTGAVRGTPEEEVSHRTYTVTMSFCETMAGDVVQASFGISSPQTSGANKIYVQAECYIEFATASPPLGLFYPCVEQVIGQSIFTKEGDQPQLRHRPHDTRNKARSELPPLPSHRDSGIRIIGKRGSMLSVKSGIPGGGATMSSSSSPVPDASPGGALPGGSQPSVVTVSTTPRPSQSIRVAPILHTGSAVHFQVEPQLPRGLDLESLSGEISGAPEVSGPGNFASTHTVLAENEIGVASCRVSIEVTHGYWGLSYIYIKTEGHHQERYCESGSASQTPSQKSVKEVELLGAKHYALDMHRGSMDNTPITSPLGRMSFASCNLSAHSVALMDSVNESPEEPTETEKVERHWVDEGTSSAVDWGRAVEKSAHIIKTCGRYVQVAIAPGSEGRGAEAAAASRGSARGGEPAAETKIVKGMTLNKVLGSLGLGQDPDFGTTLPRAMHHYDQTGLPLPGGGLSIGRAGGLAGEKVVYLRGQVCCERNAALRLAPVNLESPQSAAPTLPPPQAPATPRSKRRSGDGTEVRRIWMAATKTQSVAAKACGGPFDDEDVGERFNALLPYWKNKVVEIKQQERYANRRRNIHQADQVTLLARA